MKGEVLSLSELETYDPRPMRCGRKHRYCCPFCGDSKPRDNARRCLSLDIDSGLWKCFRCQRKGLIKEKWLKPSSISKRQRKAAALKALFNPESTSQKVQSGKNAAEGDSAQNPKTNYGSKKWQRDIKIWQKDFPNSSGQAYLEKRGIDPETAIAFGCGYTDQWEHWEEDENGKFQLKGTDRRVVYPVTDKEGNLFAVQGRAIDDEFLGSDKITKGEKSLGLFQTPDALKSDVLILAEGPSDAMALYQCGFSAAALLGTSIGDWLISELSFRKVLIGFDDDEHGETQSDKRIPVLRSRGARAFRLRPEGGKDWNDVLVNKGIDFLRSFVEERIADAFYFRKLLRRYEPTPVWTHCPICTIEIKREETDVLIHNYCPFGCSFTQTRFTDTREAVSAAVSALFDGLTEDERQAIYDAIDERAAILSDNFDVDSETALQIAKEDVLPSIIFDLQNRFDKQRNK
jgi:hypothetical protein